MNLKFDPNIDKPRNLYQKCSNFLYWFESREVEIKTPLHAKILKQLNFEFDPNIDIPRNLEQKYLHFLYNFNHLRAGRLRLKPRFMHRHYS